MIGLLVLRELFKIYNIILFILSLIGEALLILTVWVAGDHRWYQSSETVKHIDS